MTLPPAAKEFAREVEKVTNARPDIVGATVAIFEFCPPSHVFYAYGVCEWVWLDAPSQTWHARIKLASGCVLTHPVALLKRVVLPKQMLKMRIVK